MITRILKKFVIVVGNDPIVGSIAETDLACKRQYELIMKRRFKETKSEKLIPVEISFKDLTPEKEEE